MTHHFFLKIKLLFLFLVSAIWVQAQYSYITDRRFYEPDDFVGYDFKPSVMEIPNQKKQDLDPGEFSFGITFNNLYVKGGDIQGVYNINNIHPEDYGYKLLLMNARDARLQGHLKIIQNKYGMVEMLVFKRSPDDKEVIFYLPLIPERLKEQEKAYFTDRGELVIEESDSLWGKKFYPFFRIHNDAKVQERLQMRDSASISFLETITIEEKDKKKKKSKGEPELADVAIDTIPAVMDSLTHFADSTELISDPDKKVKIIKEYFVIVRSIVQYEDGLREDKTWKYPIRRVSEKEDKKAGLQEERYLWEFINDKKELIQLYLNGDHTVSSMHIGEKTYQMRGF